MARTPCQYPDCESPVASHGYCFKHWKRVVRNGTPDDPKKRYGLSPDERFWLNVEERGPEECWPWTSYVDDYGYGQFKVEGRVVRSHVWAYTSRVGPVPEGKVLDHLCHVGDCPAAVCEHRRCCNPTHLSPTTRGDNVSRTARRQAATGVRKSQY